MGMMRSAGFGGAGGGARSSSPAKPVITIAGVSACSLAIFAAVVLLQAPPVKDLLGRISQVVMVEISAQIDQAERSAGKPPV